MTDVEVYENGNLPVQHHDQPGTYELLWRLAQRVSATDFVPSAFRGKPEAVLAAFVTGAENGNGPMQSLRMYQVIQGSVGLKPEAMRAEVAKAGHLIETVDYTDTKVTLHGKRADNGQTETVTWTLDDAKRAGLSGKNWTSYPRAMLLARATSELCRLMFSDVTLGLAYNADELEEMAPAPTPLSHSRQLPPANVDGETGEVVTPAPAEVVETKVAEARSAIRRAPGRKASASDTPSEASGREATAANSGVSEPASAAGDEPAAKPGRSTRKFPPQTEVERLRSDVATLSREQQHELREWLAANHLPSHGSELSDEQMPRVVEWVRTVQAENERAAAEARVG